MDVKVKGMMTHRLSVFLVLSFEAVSHGLTFGHLMG